MRLFEYANRLFTNENCLFEEEIRQSEYAALNMQLGEMSSREFTIL